jgi:hypothetical protein
MIPRGLGLNESNLDQIEDWLSENEPEIQVSVNPDGSLTFKGTTHNSLRGKRENKLSWDRVEFSLKPNTYETSEGKSGEYYLRNALVVKLINEIHNTNYPIPNANISPEWGIFRL